jgi:hypothetical protein
LIKKIEKYWCALRCCSVTCTSHHS